MESFHYTTLYETERYHWWFSVRRTIVKNLISKHWKSGDTPKLLDIGCGTGQLLIDLASQATVSGVDPSEEAVRFCRDRKLENIVPGALPHLPFPDATFDIVLCLDVLEHIPEDTLGIQEIYRLLKPGGIAIIFVPTFSFLWGTSDIISHHYRRYRLPELATKLKVSNFTILRSSYFNFFLFLPILIARWIVRLLGLPIKSENTTGSGIFNNILRFLFSAEAKLLRHTDFPFGVSGLLVCKK